MTHEKFLAENRIVPEIAARELDGVLAELVSVFEQTGELDAAVAAEVLGSAQQKAEGGITGAIGRGVAVPHVKVPGVTRTAAVLGRCADGLDFRAGDGLAVHVVFLVLGPVDAPEEHLQLLRWIAGLAHNPDFTRFALTCKTPSDLFELVQELAST